MNDTVKKVRVLVVDDSAFARLTISKYLATDPSIEVVGLARDGLDALEKVKLLDPDVVTMDVEMPKLDGIGTLERIMAEYPRPVIMLSSITAEGAEVTIRALELGAIDFFLKPSLINPTGRDEVNNDLIDKIKNAASIDVSKLVWRVKKLLAGTARTVAARPVIRRRIGEKPRRVVIIGSSTGGPRALYEVVPGIPADIPATVVIVQHMPAKFTKSLADRLNEISSIPVKEAEAGDRLLTGHALVAPGGFHMVITPGGGIELTLDRPVCGLRPAIDVTMESLVQNYGASCLGVVLTGMGSDGTNGCAMIKAAGGSVISEDESTCVIYGMPRCVAEAGLADYVVPLGGIAGQITEYCNKTCIKDARISV
jgi:two-component system chemotaxis response regulator CheB